MNGEFLIRKMLVNGQKYLAGNPLFEALEKKAIQKLSLDSDNLHPPVFIVGAPRTGSTLLYQMLVCNYNFSYLSNFSSFFYKSPLWATSFTKKFFKRYNPDKYESSYGLVPGLWAPSEAGQIFRYWFGEKEFSDAKNSRIKNTIYGISKIQKGPFIWKNLDLSMKIKNLLTIFPDAVFIHSKRDPIFTAQSLLIARKKRYGTYERWFGIKPPNYKEILKKNPFEQVVLQIKSIEDCIRNNISSGRYLEIEYEKLCSNPYKTIKDIIRFLNTKNVPVKEVNKKYMDTRISNRIRLKEEEYKKLIQYINKYYGESEHGSKGEV